MAVPISEPITRAAIKVLRMAGRPLHHREIVKEMLAAGIWAPERGGSTPEDTIRIELKAGLARFPEVVEVDTSMYALAQWYGRAAPTSPDAEEYENAEDELTIAWPRKNRLSPGRQRVS